MTEEEFSEVIGPAAKRWKYTPEILERIFNHVRHVNSWRFRIIVNHFLDSSRQAPLPRDFQDAARKERSPSQNSDKRPEPSCSHCFDGGILLLQARDGSHKTLCKCTCPCGEKQTYQMPVWNENLNQTFTRKPVTTDQVGISIKMDGSMSITQLTELAAAWKEQIQIAEQYWLQNG